MRKVKQLNQHRRDYIYNPKQFRRAFYKSTPALSWFPFFVGVFVGVVFSFFIYKKHTLMFLYLLDVFL